MTLADTDATIKMAAPYVVPIELALENAIDACGIWMARIASFGEVEKAGEIAALLCDGNFVELRKHADKCRVRSIDNDLVCPAAIAAFERIELLLQIGSELTRREEAAE